MKFHLDPDGLDRPRPGHLRKRIDEKRGRLQPQVELLTLFYFKKGQVEREGLWTKVRLPHLPVFFLIPHRVPQLYPPCFLPSLSPSLFHFLLSFFLTSLLQTPRHLEPSLLSFSPRVSFTTPLLSLFLILYSKSSPLSSSCSCSCSFSHLSLILSNFCHSISLCFSFMVLLIFFLSCDEDCVGEQTSHQTRRRGA